MGEEKRSGWKEAAEGRSDRVPGDTPIQNMYSFWYIKRNSGNKGESYEKSIKELGDFKSVQGFWRIYNHLVRPNDLPNTMDYHLFKTGIKPMWEDPANRRGGKWMVRIRKGVASRYWEDLVLAIIGEQFDVGNEICGAVVSIRYNEDIISLWNRNADNNEACYRIRDTMRKVLNLPSFVALEYKRHDASLSDNSSFRNTTLWRPDKSGNSGSSRSLSANQRDNSNSSGRFSRDKFDRASATSTPSRAAAWTRDSKRPFFTKSSSANGDADGDSKASAGDSKASSVASPPPNAWGQK